MASGRDPAVRDEWGLTEDQTTTSAWCVAPGIQFPGASAIALALAVAWQTRLPLLPWRLPGGGRALDALYGLVARNRHRIP